MSRHRNVRNYAYEEDMSDDVYGHSVEDHEMCISPSTAHQFMYNRNNEDHKRNVFGHYMDTRFGCVEEQVEEEQSEEEDHLSHSQDYRRPQLDPISQAKLSSCLDQLQSILGDDCHEPTAVEAIIKFDFDAEKALDYIFEKGNKKGNAKQPKKSDSSLCCNPVSCIPTTNTFVPATTLSSLLSNHLTNSQLPNSKSLNSPNPLSLNAYKPKEQAASHASLSMDSHQATNSGISLLGPSLKSLAEKDKLSKPSLSMLTENKLIAASLSGLASSSVGNTSNVTGLGSQSAEDKLMKASLSGLANSSVGNILNVTGLGSQSAEDKLMKASLSGLANSSVGNISNSTQLGSKSVESNLMAASLSSLASQSDDRNMEKCQFRNFSVNALFPTTLSSLASQDRNEKLPGQAGTFQINKPTEKALMSPSLSSLSAVSHLPKNVSLPFQDMTTSLPNLSSQNDSSLMDLSLSECSRPVDRTHVGDFLSNLHVANKSTCNATNTCSLQGISKEKSSLERGQKLSNQHLEASLSALSISSVNSKHEKDAAKLPSFSMTSVESQPTLSQELKTGEAKATKFKQIECKSRLGNIKKSGGLFNEATARKMIKKHKTRCKSNPLVRVKPSMFAFTLCYSVKRRSDIVVAGSLTKRLCSVNRHHGFGNIVPFDFQTPSPDDFIQMKQKHGFSH